MPLPPAPSAAPPPAPSAQPASPPPHRARIASTCRAPPALRPERGRRSRSDLLVLKSPQPPGRRPSEHAQRMQPGCRSSAVRTAAAPGRSISRSKDDQITRKGGFGSWQFVGTKIGRGLQRRSCADGVLASAPCEGAAKGTG
ncbi:hypothetical protein U9M48_021558 [Paspalum notatum var. saurae]|uniref:Uncharacterized protein n=1 Tax=Paspalum notatum var. saurae TaxID=547442 RepID=A0AAQ3WU36_PASNO